MLFSKGTNSIALQLLKYAFVGAFALLVDTGTLHLLTDFFRVHYLLSAVWAFAFGAIVNYLLSIAWVFPRRNISDQRIEFSVFVVIGITGAGLNELLIWIFTDSLGFHYVASKLISAIFVFSWNFFARKFILFR